ncbi:MAG: hypothetical protein WCJ97_01935 [Phycisphaerae bacterium]
MTQIPRPAVQALADVRDRQLYTGTLRCVLALLLMGLALLITLGWLSAGPQNAYMRLLVPTQFWYQLVLPILLLGFGLVQGLDSPTSLQRRLARLAYLGAVLGSLSILGAGWLSWYVGTAVHLHNGLQLGAGGLVTLGAVLLTWRVLARVVARKQIHISDLYLIGTGQWLVLAGLVQLGLHYRHFELEFLAQSQRALLFKLSAVAVVLHWLGAAAMRGLAEWLPIQRPMPRAFLVALVLLNLGLLGMLGQTGILATLGVAFLLLAVGLMVLGLNGLRGLKIGRRADHTLWAASGVALVIGLSGLLWHSLQNQPLDPVMDTLWRTSWALWVFPWLLGGGLVGYCYAQNSPRTLALPVTIMLISGILLMLGGVWPKVWWGGAMQVLGGLGMGLMLLILPWRMTLNPKN